MDIVSTEIVSGKSNSNLFSCTAVLIRIVLSCISAILVFSIYISDVSALAKTKSKKPTISQKITLDANTSKSINLKTNGSKILSVKASSSNNYVFEASASKKKIRINGLRSGEGVLTVAVKVKSLGKVKTYRLKSNVTVLNKTFGEITVEAKNAKTLLLSFKNRTITYQDILGFKIMTKQEDGFVNITSDSIEILDNGKKAKVFLDTPGLQSDQEYRIYSRDLEIENYFTFHRYTKTCF